MPDGVESPGSQTAGSLDRISTGPNPKPALTNLASSIHLARRSPCRACTAVDDRFRAVRDVRHAVREGSETKPPGTKRSAVDAGHQLYGQLIGQGAGSRSRCPRSVLEQPWGRKHRISERVKVPKRRAVVLNPDEAFGGSL